MVVRPGGGAGWRPLPLLLGPSDLPVNFLKALNMFPPLIDRALCKYINKVNLNKIFSEHLSTTDYEPRTYKPLYQTK